GRNGRLRRRRGRGGRAGLPPRLGEAGLRRDGGACCRAAARDDRRVPLRRRADGAVPLPRRLVLRALGHGPWGPSRPARAGCAARELWGDAAAANEAIHVDLWESYLEPA